MSEKYELVFAGQTIPGAPMEKVKANAAKLFNADPAQLEKLFSGSPVVLKNNLEKATAAGYQSKLKSAGMVCTLREMGSKTEPQTAIPKPTPSKQAAAKDSDWSLAPTGADVNPHDPAPIPPMPDTSQFSLKEQKGYLFDQNDAPPPPAPDTSHITME